MADLTEIQASQSVKLAGADSTGQETTFANVTANGDLNATNTIGSGGAQANLAVGLTSVEVRVGAARLAVRKVVTVFPFDADMFWGFSNTVSVSTGTPIFKNQLVVLNASEFCQIWIICASAGKNARITESP